MRYGEKVMLHNLVHLTMADKKAYSKLSGSADTRFWFMAKHKFLDLVTDVLDRYIYDYNIISNIAVRERHELRAKKNKEEEAKKLYNIQADLLDEVVDIKGRMILTLESIAQSMSLRKSFSLEDITDLIELTNGLVPKLRDLSDVVELLEKYDVPFYKNLYKS